MKRAWLVFNCVWSLAVLKSRPSVRSWPPPCSPASPLPLHFLTLLPPLLCPSSLLRLCLSPFATTALYDDYVSPPPPIDSLDLGLWLDLISQSNFLAWKPKKSCDCVIIPSLSNLNIQFQSCAIQNIHMQCSYKLAWSLCIEAGYTWTSFFKMQVN